MNRNISAIYWPDPEPQIGVLLPCNVVVRKHDGNVVVEAMNPGDNCD